MAETDSELIKKLLKMVADQNKEMEKTKEKLSIITEKLSGLEYRVSLNNNSSRQFLKSDKYSEVTHWQVNRFEPSSLQLAIIQELEKANKWISIYDLSARLGKSRHYINAKINELVQRGLIRRVPNVEQQKSSDEVPTPRYLYQIDDSGENLLQKLFD